jgi:hypothetical protein
MNVANTFTFTVEGEGLFPVDMLRVDQCWPYERLDDLAIQIHPLATRAIAMRRIVLATHHRYSPTREAWKRLGWHVVGFGVHRT